MAGYTLVHQIPQPFTTVGGKTSGPAVALGRFRGQPGGPLWLHLDELRDAVHTAGWPLPEVHQALADEIAALKQHADELVERIAGLEQENQTLRDAHAALTAPALTGSAPQEPAAKVAAAKPKAKAAA